MRSAAESTHILVQFNFREEDMEQIKASDTLNTILKRPEFKAHKDSIALMPGILGSLVNTLSMPALSKITGGTWNPESMADGLNHLSRLCSEQNCFCNIWSDEDIAADKTKVEAKLIAFPLPEKSRFVLICPGGAYMSVASIVEGFPAAKKLNELGYAAFVLKYRCGKHALAPNPMDDLAAALRLILDNADRFNIDPNQYTVMGFSAGGHLAASFGTESLGYVNYHLPKPANMVLAYPVITMGNKSHAGSVKNLLGTKNTHNSSLIEKWSVEQHLTENYPPTFVWQCDHDNTVPVENTSMLAEGLRVKGVKVHYETFRSDAHGWGIAEGTPAEGWLERAVDFIKEQEDPV